MVYRAMLSLVMVHSLVGGSVYYGSLEDAKKPAELRASTVFSEIPEYQKIQQEGLDQNSPEYWSLLAKANEKFYGAVRKVAEKHTYDAVVEKGSAGLEGAPDITDEVIDALPE